MVSTTHLQVSPPHRRSDRLSAASLPIDPWRTGPHSPPGVCETLQIRDELIGEVHRHAIGSRLHDLLH